MSRHISDERLDIIHAQLSGEIRRRIDKPWIYVESKQKYIPIIQGHDLICLLDELRMRRSVHSRTGHSQFKLGKTAKILIAMKVGETVELEPITKGALTTARTTARKHLGVPDAAWWSRTTSDGLVAVTRAPDGSPPHAKYHNAAVYELAVMKVDETRILTTLVGKMHNAIKIHARRIMDNSEANWQCQNLANGDVRCKRIK